MKTFRRNAVHVVLVWFASAGYLRTQAQTETRPKSAGNYAELKEAKAKLESAEKRLNDWPNLARYRDENKQVPAPAENEQRVVFMGDSITEM